MYTATVAAYSAAATGCATPNTTIVTTSILILLVVIPPHVLPRLSSDSDPLIEAYALLILLLF